LRKVQQQHAKVFMLALKNILSRLYLEQLDLKITNRKPILVWLIRIFGFLCNKNLSISSPVYSAISSHWYRNWDVVVVMVINVFGWIIGWLWVSRFLYINLISSTQFLRAFRTKFSKIWRELSHFPKLFKASNTNTHFMKVLWRMQKLIRKLDMFKGWILFVLYFCIITLISMNVYKCLSILWFLASFGKSISLISSLRINFQPTLFMLSSIDALICIAIL
jgi:hypothetical protein